MTGQHRQMLDAALAMFEIRPDFDLNIMRANQQLTDIAAATLTGVAKVIDEFQPDRVLVQGDTTTTMAASIAAFYKHVPVGHVERVAHRGHVGSFSGRG